MFSEDSLTIPAFAPSAKIFYVFTSALFGSAIVAFIGAILAIFFMPVLILIPILIIFELWYYNKYINKFRYALQKDHFFVRKGVFGYNYTFIPYNNIQDIHVSQSFFESMLGIWNLSIFTATASARGSEVLPCLSRGVAESLKEQLMEKVRAGKHDAN